jgi:hypothetical protein
MFRASFTTRLILGVTILLLSLGLSACAQAAAPQTNTGPVTPAVAPTETAVPGTTQDGLTYRLDSGLASGATVENVTVGAGTADSPYWMTIIWSATPEFRQMTLEGYPVKHHQYKPQIFVFPVKEFSSAQAGVAGQIEAMQSLLRSGQQPEELPFLPLINAKPAILFGIQKLDFQNGKGIRYLTQYNQGLVMINNQELIYTYQGLTNDGKYYVAVVMPATHPSLPAEPKVTDKDPGQYPGYLTDLAGQMAAQPAGSFTPDLARLDALVRSLEIQ